jgi:hypothetical protein
MPNLTEPVEISFIISTIAVIVTISLISIVLVKKYKD